MITVNIIQGVQSNIIEKTHATIEILQDGKVIKTLQAIVEGSSVAYENVWQNFVEVREKE